MKKPLLIQIVILSIHCFLIAQVNTEAMRNDDEIEGLKNKFSLELEYEKADSEVLELSSAYRVDYKSKNNFHAFLAIKYNNGFEKESDQEKNIIKNKGFAHLRATKNISENFGIESFTQYEFNDFLLISSRQLIGLGSRLELNHGKTANTFLGIGLMKEIEKYKGEGENLNNEDLIRSTNYIRNSMEISSNVTLGNTCYIQIATDDLNDYRILYDGKINFNISESIDFEFSVNYRYDNEPHGNLESSYVQISNGLSIEF